MNLRSALAAVRRSLSLPTSNLAGQTEYNLSMLRFEIVEAIWAEMKRQKLTEAALAERAGLLEGFVMTFLMSKDVPDLRVLARIAAALGMSLKVTLGPLEPGEDDSST
jgi:predicted nucleic acid-binding protein